MAGKFYVGQRVCRRDQKVLGTVTRVVLRRWMPGAEALVGVKWDGGYEAMLADQQITPAEAPRTR